MTRTEAADMVRNRWQFLGIGTPEEFPRVFSSDVENMMASTGNILDVAPQGDISNEGSTTNGRTQHCHTQEVLREGFTPNRHDGNEGVLGCADGAREGRLLRIGGEATRNRIDVAGLAAGNAPVKDSPLVGNEGVSSAQANPQGSSDSQINQGLTIEWLIDSAIRAEEHAAEIEQYRAEEEAAAEEGALIEASNMPYPEYERNGR